MKFRVHALHIPTTTRPTTPPITPATLTGYEITRRSVNGTRVLYTPRDGGAPNPLATHLTRTYARRWEHQTDVYGDAYLLGWVPDDYAPDHVPATAVAAAMSQFDSGRYRAAA